MSIVYGAIGALGELGRKTVKEGTTLEKRVGGMRAAMNKYLDAQNPGSGFRETADSVLYNSGLLRKEKDGTISASGIARLYSDKGDGSLRTGVKVGAGLTAAAGIGGIGYLATKD